MTENEYLWLLTMAQAMSVLEEWSEEKYRAKLAEIEKEYRSVSDDKRIDDSE